MKCENCKNYKPTNITYETFNDWIARQEEDNALVLLLCSILLPYIIQIIFIYLYFKNRKKFIR